MAGQRTLSLIDGRVSFAVRLYAYGVITKMESKNYKRLKLDEEDRVRAGYEGNVTAGLVVPLLERQIPGKETYSYEVFEFRAALFLIHDIIYYGPLSLLHMEDIYFQTAWTLTQYSQSVLAPVNEFNLGKGDISCTTEKMANNRSNNHLNEDDDNTLVECHADAILPTNASKGDEQQVTVAVDIAGKYIFIIHTHTH